MSESSRPGFPCWAVVTRPPATRAQGDAAGQLPPDLRPQRRGLRLLPDPKWTAGRGARGGGRGFGPAHIFTATCTRVRTRCAVDQYGAFSVKASIAASDSQSPPAPTVSCHAPYQSATVDCPLAPRRAGPAARAAAAQRLPVIHPHPPFPHRKHRPSRAGP